MGHWKMQQSLLVTTAQFNEICSNEVLPAYTNLRIHIYGICIISMIVNNANESKFWVLGSDNNKFSNYVVTSDIQIYYQLIKKSRNAGAACLNANLYLAH